MTITAVNRAEPVRDPDAPPDGRPAAGLGAWLAGNFLEERERWFLWLPVALALGIGIYFSLGQEPPRWPTPVLIVMLALASWASRRLPWLFLASILVLTAAVGFGAAQIRTASLEGPLVQERTRPGLVQGRVVAAEPAGRGWRIVLQDPEIEAIDEALTPDRVRIVLQSRDPPPDPGAIVSLKAVLMPLPSPAMPDAFDFARHIFFQGLGGVGYAISEVEVEETPAAPTSVADAVSMARRVIGSRIAAALDGGTEEDLTRRSLAEALLIGQRGAIPEHVVAAMRDSGLAHILAISGLHISLVAGLVFFTVRAGLALAAPVALRWPIRKWAAGVALLVALGYLLLSGATVPTQRAFLMLAIGLVAIVADRFQITMRPVAWAALAVLLVMPESLVGASFQMSFAAVVGLVAAYEAVRSRWRAIGTGAGLARDPTRARASVVGLYFLAVAFTSIVATLATGPLAIANFNRLAVYGVAANLLAVPVTAFWIMPWGIAALALMPMGFEAPALVAMAWGLDALIWVAREVASWPGAVLLVPAVPTHAVALVALGGLWLAIWRRRWRLLGLPLMAAGLVTATFSDLPDVLVSADARLVAISDNGDVLRASSLAREKFTRGVWMQRLAVTKASDWRSAEAERDGRLACDALGCVFRKGPALLALPWNERALLDDCAVSDAVVATVPVEDAVCAGPTVIIDRFDLWREGAHAVWLDGRDITYRSVRDGQGDRPWSLWPD